MGGAGLAWGRSQRGCGDGASGASGASGAGRGGAELTTGTLGQVALQQVEVGTLSVVAAAQGGSSPCPWWSGRTVRAATSSLGPRDSAISHEPRSGWVAWSRASAVGPHGIWKAPVSGMSQDTVGGKR